MKSLRNRVCEASHWSEETFARNLFWHCLHRHALPLVPLLGGRDADFFAADRDFIAAVARAARMSQVRLKVREYCLDPRNRGWLRTRANVRVSAHRVLRLASKYLPGGDTVLPVVGIDGN
jgi:hypothetical protein